MERSLVRKWRTSSGFLVIVFSGALIYSLCLHFGLSVVLTRLFTASCVLIGVTFTFLEVELAVFWVSLRTRYLFPHRYHILIAGCAVLMSLSAAHLILRAKYVDVSVLTQLTLFPIGVLGVLGFIFKGRVARRSVIHDGLHDAAVPDTHQGEEEEADKRAAGSIFFETIDDWLSKGNKNEVLNAIKELEGTDIAEIEIDIIKSRAYVALNMYEQILEIFKKYKQTPIPSARLVYYFAKGLQSRGDLRMARRLLEEKNEESKHQNPYLLIKIGLICFFEHKYEKAIEKATAAIDINEDCTLAIVFKALFTAARASHRKRDRVDMGDYAKEIDRAMRILEAREDLPKYIVKNEKILYQDIKAYILYLQGDLHKARAILKKTSSKANHTNAWVHFHLGLVYGELEQFTNALYHLTISLKLETENLMTDGPLAKAVERRLLEFTNKIYEEGLEN